MPPEPKAVALAHLRELGTRLQTGASPDVASLVDEIGHLSRAVESSHMEAIRFRLYGLRRRLASYAEPGADQARASLDDAWKALRAAGFNLN